MRCRACKRSDFRVLYARTPPALTCLRYFRGQIVYDWVRQVTGEACDDVGGVLVPFGSSAVNVGDKNSDIDVVLIVSDDVAIHDFLETKATSGVFLLLLYRLLCAPRSQRRSIVPYMHRRWFILSVSCMCLPI